MLVVEISVPSYLVESAGKLTDNEHPEFGRTSSALTLKPVIVIVSIEKPLTNEFGFESEQSRKC